MASFVDSQVFTDPGTTLADSHTASAGGLELFLCASERGTTGTSPGTLSYGGVNALATTGGPVTALCQTPSGQRAHRWYHIPRANHPGPGTHAISCVWAGVDNVAVCVVEVSATGEVTITANNQSSTNATVPITAGDGDLTIGCAQANSATPAFAPVNGQTEYEESVWYSNSGHVIGVQTGAQTAASWTGAGSICASAFVIHEESSGLEEIELGGEALGGGQISSAAAALVTMAGALMGGARVVGSLEPRISAEASARGAAQVPAAATPSLVADAATRGAGQASSDATPSLFADAGVRGAGQASSAATPSLVAFASSVGGSRVTVAAVPSLTLAGSAQGAGRVSSEAPPIVLEGAARGAGRVMGSVSVLATAAGSTRGAARASASAVVTSIASGAARAAGRILGALRVLVGLGGDARAAGRVTGGEGEIEYEPSPPGRTRLAARGALRSRVAARTRRRTRIAAGLPARTKVAR